MHNPFTLIDMTEHKWCHQKAIMFACELDEIRPGAFSSSSLEGIEWKIEHLLLESQYLERKRIAEMVESLKYRKDTPLSAMDLAWDAALDAVIKKLKGI